MAVDGTRSTMSRPACMSDPAVGIKDKIIIQFFIGHHGRFQHFNFAGMLDDGNLVGSQSRRRCRPSRTRDTPSVSCRWGSVPALRGASAAPDDWCTQRYLKRVEKRNQKNKLRVSRNREKKESSTRNWVVRSARSRWCHPMHHTPDRPLLNILLEIQLRTENYYGQRMLSLHIENESLHHDLASK